MCVNVNYKVSYYRTHVVLHVRVTINDKLSYYRTQYRNTSGGFICVCVVKTKNYDNFIYANLRLWFSVSHR